MPEELMSYFEKKYLEFKRRAKTYGELKRLIDKESKDACFSDVAWGNLLRAQLSEQLEKDIGSLCIK